MWSSWIPIGLIRRTDIPPDGRRLAVWPWLLRISLSLDSRVPLCLISRPWKVTRATDRIDDKTDCFVVFKWACSALCVYSTNQFADFFGNTKEQTGIEDKKKGANTIQSYCFRKRTRGKTIVVISALRSDTRRCGLSLTNVRRANKFLLWFWPSRKEEHQI